MAARNVGFIVSSICFVLSLFMLLSGLNLGIDFRGGTMIGLNFSEDVEIQEVRAAMQSISIEGQEELSGKALWPIISALGLILFYISIRFEFKFAIGAILALVHDIIITLGIFSLTGYEITLGTVAAFLTIVGYSLNDTIVILDRIRENMRSSGTLLFEATINKSINQSLSRTLITSLTTLVVIVVLIYAGGEIIRPFAFTMLVGVIIGTYSSIYIASGLLASVYKSSN